MAGNDDDYRGVLALGNPSDYSDDPRAQGAQLRMDGLHAGLAQGTPGATKVRASLSGPMPKYSHGEVGNGPGPSMVHPDDRAGMMSTSAAHAQPRPQAAPQQRMQSPDELMAMAHQMLDSQAAQTQGSSISPRDASGSQVTDTNGQKLPDWLVRQQEGQ